MFQTHVPWVVHRKPTEIGMQHPTFTFTLGCNIENWVSFWSNWSATCIKFLRCFPLFCHAVTLHPRWTTTRLCLLQEWQCTFLCRLWCDTSFRDLIAFVKKTVMVLQPNPSSQVTTLMYIQISRKFILSICWPLMKGISISCVHVVGSVVFWTALPRNKWTQGFMKVRTPSWWYSNICNIVFLFSLFWIFQDLVSKLTNDHLMVVLD